MHRKILPQENLSCLFKVIKDWWVWLVTSKLNMHKIAPKKSFQKSAEVGVLRFRLQDLCWGKRADNKLLYLYSADEFLHVCVFWWKYMLI